MASFRRLPSGKFLAEIRRAGLPNISRAFPTATAAKQWARQIEGEIDRGEFQQKILRAQVPTVRELLSRYEREITQTKKGALQERYRLQKFQDEAYAPFVSKPITDVTEADIRGWRDRRLADVSEDTVRREMVVLGAFFNQCGKGAKSRSGAIKGGGWGFIQGNPVESAGKPKGGSRRKRRVLQAEIDAVCEVSESSDLAAFIRLATQTAMRRGEIAKITVRDVVFDGGLGYIKLHEGETKNNAARAVPLTPEAMQLVQGLLQGKDPSARVFALKPNTYTQAFIRARKRARYIYERKCKAEGVEPDPDFLVNLRLHDHRHEATSRLFEVHKLGVLEAAEITGHKDLLMLKSYSHQEPLKLAASLAKTAVQERYPAVAQKTKHGFRVILPDFPDVAVDVKSLEAAASVAAAIISAQLIRPRPTPLEVVRQKYPGGKVFLVR